MPPLRLHSIIRRSFRMTFLGRSEVGNAFLLSYQRRVSHEREVRQENCLGHRSRVLTIALHRRVRCNACSRITCRGVTPATCLSHQCMSRYDSVRGPVVTFGCNTFSSLQLRSNLAHLWKYRPDKSHSRGHSLDIHVLIPALWFHRQQQSCLPTLCAGRSTTKQTSNVTTWTLLGVHVSSKAPHRLPSHMYRPLQMRKSSTIARTLLTWWMPVTLSSVAP